MRTKTDSDRWILRPNGEIETGFRFMRTGQTEWAILGPDNSVLHYCENEQVAQLMAKALESAS